MTTEPTLLQRLKCYFAVILDKFHEQLKFITGAFLLFIGLNLLLKKLFCFVPLSFKAALILALLVHILYAVLFWDEPYYRVETDGDDPKEVKNACKPLEWNRVVNFAKSVYYWLSVGDVVIILWLLNH